METDVDAMVAEIEHAADGATPGPWHPHPCCERIGEPGHPQWYSVRGPAGERVVTGERDGGIANARYIVAACNAAPKLAALVRAQHDALTHATAAFDEMRERAERAEAQAAAMRAALNCAESYLEIEGGLGEDDARRDLCEALARVDAADAGRLAAEVLRASAEYHAARMALRETEGSGDDEWAAVQSKRGPWEQAVAAWRGGKAVG